MPIRLPFLSKNTPKVDSASFITVVSGLPRSGTSMMMKMLEAGGLDVLTDHIRLAEENNPGGYYEFERVKKLKDGDREWLKEARGRAVKIVSAHLEHLPPEHRYKIIFMRREMKEILASQRKMLETRNEPADKVSDEKMAELYEKHLDKITVWLAKQPNMEVIYVNYNEILKGPQDDLIRVAQFLGKGLDIEPMVATVDPGLYRQRRS